MNWLFRLTTTDYVFISVFILLYALYVRRTFRLAAQLGASAWGVVPKFFLRGTYLALLVVALLGPSFGETEGPLTTVSRDVYVVLDVSRSMDAGDVVPTRLERIKYDIRNLCDTLPGDRLGLILAADESVVLSPLTADHEALKHLVADVRTSAPAAGGTDLCPALDLACRQLTADSSTRSSARAVVLFSDGENARACEPGLFARLRADGVTVFTVGVGTETGAAIREGQAFIRDEGGQIVRSRLNRAFLEQVARSGRGQYLEAGADGRFGNELARLLRALPARGLAKGATGVSTNKYYYFLLAALILIGLDLLITVRTFRL